MSTSTGLALTAALLQKPPLHIPDPEGSNLPYKTEFVPWRSEAPQDFSVVLPLLEGLVGRENAERLQPTQGGVTAIKINWWHAPDPRGNPHSHPWKEFNSLILYGGYTETVVSRGYRGNEPIIRTYTAGDINHNVEQEFHTVDTVEKGTVTLMVCGEMTEGGVWGHLVNGEFVPAGKDSSYFGKIQANNRFMLPRS